MSELPGQSRQLRPLHFGPGCANNGSGGLAHSLRSHASPHNSKFQNFATPAPIIAAPRIFATNFPFDESFSSDTRPAREAIQGRFITPPTNSRAISAQQQLRQ